MDPNNTSRRRHSLSLSTQPPPLRVLRSRSGAPTAMSLPEARAPSQRFTTTRSKSTSRSRPSSTPAISNRHDVGNSIVGLANVPKTPTVLKKHQQNSNSVSAATRKTQSAPPSPSAWALSPGRAALSTRSLATLEISSEHRVHNSSKPKAEKSASNASGVSRVLKYFKPKKKVSPIEEEEIHRLRIMHNRLMQWRFANARAVAARANVKRVAEERLFRVWATISKMRYSVMEKQIEVDRLRHTTKVYQIVSPQVRMLQECWANKLERKHSEGLSRMTRKLAALSLLLPLADAKADVVSVAGAMEVAMEATQKIQSTSWNLSSQAEELYYLQAELVSTLKRQRLCLQELEDTIPFLLTLAAREKSLRVHLIQAATESCREPIDLIASPHINQ